MCSSYILYMFHFLSSPSPPRKGNIADHMLGLMERYASNLEEAIEEQTLVLAKEKARTEALIYRLLPK